MKLLLKGTALIVILLFFNNPLRSQCDSLSLGEDLFVCAGTPVTLDAGEGYLTYLWNTGSTAQTITVTEPGDYWCTVVQVDSNSLIVNGEFTSGNTGFSSDYTNNQSSLWNEATYAVVSNPTTIHPNFSSCGDHTTGNGKMMVVNGSSTPDATVWSQAVPVEPDSYYHYSGWFTSVHPTSPALLDLTINDVAIENVSLTGTTCLWDNFYAVWYSGTATTANLRIVNQNTAADGNDFAIDDISLYGACTMSDTVTVTVAESPVVDLGPDTAVCASSSLMLDAGGPFPIYVWQDGSTGSSIEVTGSGTYWVLVVNESGCFGTDTIEVELLPSPEPDLGNDTLLCPGDAILLDPGTFSSYEWQDNSAGSTFLAEQAGTYWVTVTNDAGCVTADTLTIVPAQEPVADLGGDTSLCAGQQVILTAGGNYPSYVWQDNSTGPSYTVTENGLYWVTVANGCGTDSDTVSVTFQPLPNPDLGNDTVICSGQSLTLQPEGSFAGYAWQDGSDFPFFVVTTGGFYSVEVVNVWGCSNTDEIFVEVSSPEVYLGDDTYLCEGETLQLDAGDGFATYLWQDGADGQYYDVSQDGDYSVTVTDPYGCEANGTVTVEAVTLPVIDLHDQQLCPGDEVTLYAPEGNGNNYYWNGVPGNASLTVDQEGAYTLTVANPCDSVSAQVYVSQVSLPVIDLGDDLVLNPGESITLNAGTGFDSYLWQDGSAGQAYNVTETLYNPEDPYYSVEAMVGSCKASDSVKIEYYLVWVPSVITPNGDGKNDVFRPDPERWAGVKEHHIRVLNRWGEVVWESENFPEGWDGRQHGKPVSDGTYFWVLEAYYGDDAPKRIYKGTLSIIGSQGK